MFDIANVRTPPGAEVAASFPREYDVWLCEMTQKGVRSRRYVPGPISLQQEPALQVLHESYFAMMRVE